MIKIKIRKKMLENSQHSRKEGSKKSQMLTLVYCCTA